MIHIIGSGLLGLSIGYELLRQGLNVKILSSNLDGESSNAAVGMLAPQIEFKSTEEKLFSLMLESKNLWNNFYNQLTKDSGIDCEFQHNGSLAIATNNDDMEKLKFKARFLRQFGYEIKFLDGRETILLEPNLSSNLKGSIYFKNNDQVNAQILKKSLIKAFVKNGGKLEEKTRIKKITIQKKKIKLLSSEKCFECNKVVLAAGVWSRELLLESFGISIPMRPLKGVTMEFSHSEKENNFNHNLWFRNIYIAPRLNGNIVVGATEDEVGFKQEINMQDMFYLINNLWPLIPSSEKYEFQNFKCGLRPTTFDGLPVIGSIDKITKNLICAFGHYRNGVLLSPLTAKIVSEIIVNNKKNYNSLSPNRFKFS